MRKILFSFILFTAISFAGTCQNEHKTKDTIATVYTKSNELKINALYLMTTGYLELSYERNTKHKFSYGISIGKNLNRPVPMHYAITPYMRAYFEADVFVEATASFYRKKVRTPSGPCSSDLEKVESSNNLGLGFGFGKKYENDQGFIIEFVLGFGRGLLHTGNVSYYPRLAFNFGKKF